MSCGFILLIRFQAIRLRNYVEPNFKYQIPTNAHRNGLMRIYNDFQM